MSAMAHLIMAAFTVPEQIGTTPVSLLWMLPLIASIAIIYKTTKLPEMKLGLFVKETAVLCGSIIAFITLTALALFAVAYFIAM
jgi:hypothetical protein